VYTYNEANSQVIQWSINATSNMPVMLVSTFCRGLFVDMNSTLYCSVPDINQVVAKSLNDPTNTLWIAAGTGCSDLTPDMLSSPHGIFVHVNFSLYVADTNHHRIQRFDPGRTNATTVAGTGATGTVILLYPNGVVLDGDGYLFIVDTGHNCIIGSGPAGFRCLAGCSNGPGFAPNQLSSPRSMSFDSYGNIWVADFSNSRVQKFVLNTTMSGRYLRLRFSSVNVGSIIDFLVSRNRFRSGVRCFWTLRLFQFSETEFI
jgi:sugar lactone lactonase YvrE